MTNTEEKQKIIYSYDFLLCHGQYRIFILKLHFLYMGLNNYMQLEAEELTPEFWLFIPITPQPVSNLTTSHFCCILVLILNLFRLETMISFCYRLSCLSTL